RHPFQITLREAAVADAARLLRQEQDRGAGLRIELEQLLVRLQGGVGAAELFGLEGGEAAEQALLLGGAGARRLEAARERLGEAAEVAQLRGQRLQGVERPLVAGVEGERALQERGGALLLV